MTRVSTPPFRQAAAGSILPADWEVLSDTTWIPLGESLDAWDYATPVPLRRKVEVQLDEVRESCRLPSGAPIALSVVWHSTGTNRRGSLVNVRVEDDQIILAASLPGQNLGGQLRLHTRLILSGANPDPVPLAPRRPGSILWEDRIVVHLEGESPMFPVEVVSFPEIGLPEGAAWYLDWNPSELDHATLGAIRLFVNSDHETVHRAVTAPKADDEARAVISTLRWDLLRQLVEGALDVEDFDPSTEYAPGSLGRSLRSALTTAFGRESAGGLRSLRTIDRSRFDARIQAAAALLSP